MQLTINKVEGANGSFESVTNLRNALLGVSEDGSGDLVPTHAPLGATLSVSLTSLDPDTFAAICELVEGAGGALAMDRLVA